MGELMRRLVWLVVLLAVTVVPAAWAQDDSSASPAAEQMRQQIETRFGAQVQQTLGLTDQQAAQLRATFQTYAQQRRAMERNERALKQALQGQLRPGVAANSDSVAKVTDQLLALKVTYAQTFVDENREMAKYLSAVQRAQFQVMRERLMARIEEIRRQRQQNMMRGPASMQQP
jgi:Spy/CpxP family protein refolding chaperone